MAVTIVESSFYGKLYQDYITRPGLLKPFLSSPDHCRWPELVSGIQTHAAQHAEIKKCLIEQNSDLHEEAALRNLAKLNDPESVMVVTGQQLGLLASPLYTVYKALTAIKLAEKLARDYPNLSFVPVFWLESEDHDFEEVNHFGIWDHEFNPAQLVYNGQNLGRVPLRYYQFESGISQLIDNLKGRLLTTEFTDLLFSALHDIYQPERNWVDGSRSFLHYLLKKWGMLFFQPGAPAVKNISLKFFNLFLENKDKIDRALTETTEQLVSAGYAPQVPLIPGKAYIHFENDSRERQHLYFEADRFYLKNDTQQYSKAQVREFINNYPQRISSSVISRPLLQSWLLPVAVYVAGPAEVAYWAQLGELFGRLHLPRPVVYPRISVTLIEPKIARYITKHAPDINRIAPQKDEFIRTYFKHRSELAGSDPLEKLNRLVMEKANEVRTYLGELDPTLVPVGDKVLERISDQLAVLQEKYIRIRGEKESLLTSHLEQIHRAIFPAEKLQERYISIVYFLNKFGPDLISKIYANLTIDSFQHQFLYL
jgi:bacillithiol biosynthesis cysteine-adding enzyme BshC